MSISKEAKSLRWLANQFPYTPNPKDDTDKMCNAIHRYATAGADKIDELEKKQTPQKPLPENRYYGNGKCPRCKAVFLDKNTNYCGNCGQRLDWSVKKNEHFN